MRKKKLIALICVCVLLAVFFAGCKKKALYAAKVNGAAITRPIFVNIFNAQLSMFYGESSDGLSFDSFGTEAFYDLLVETKVPDEDRTYYEKLVEETLEQCQIFMINLELAKADKSWPSDDKMKTSKEERRSMLESYISYYGAESADQLSLMVYGIPLEDHLEYYVLSSGMDSFNDTKMDAYKVTEDELRAFYEEHTDDYEALRVRTVTVRHSLFLTQDLSSAEIAKVKEKVDGYVAAYNNGTMTMEEIVALSEDPGLETNDGYYDVTEDSSFVEAFKKWALDREEASDEIAVVETEYGYHIMMCTRIWTPDFDDKMVHDAVDQDFRGDKLEQEFKALAKGSKYRIKERNDKVIASFVRQIVTGNFDGSTPLEQTTPTAKPEYNDEATTTDVIATLGDMNLWYSDYTYFFSNAVMEIIADDLDLDETASTAEQYAALREFLNQPYKDEGITYLDKAKARALELLVQFKITWRKAQEEGESFTDEKIEALNSDVDSIIDQYLTYYGSSMGISTRDEMMRYMMGMNVNDYKRLNVEQSLISEFSQKVIEEMKPEEEDLKAYYLANKEDYRVVTVRHIFLSLLDDKGNVVSEEKKSETLQLAERLMQKLKDGDSAAVLAVAWSEASGVSGDQGLVDLKKGSSYLDKTIVEWAITQNQIGIGTLKLFETKSGYEIVLVEGILDYEDGQTGIIANTDTTLDTLKDAVEQAYKNDEFQKLVDRYVEEFGLTAENVNQELMNKAAEEYLTYEEEEDGN